MALPVFVVPSENSVHTGLRLSHNKFKRMRFLKGTAHSTQLASVIVCPLTFDHVHYDFGDIGGLVVLRGCLSKRSYDLRLVPRVESAVTREGIVRLNRSELGIKVS